MTEEQALLVANFRYGVIAPLVVQPLERGEQARMLRELSGRDYKIPSVSPPGWAREHSNGG